MNLDLFEVCVTMLYLFVKCQMSSGPHGPIFGLTVMVQYGELRNQSDRIFDWLQYLFRTL